MALIEAGRFHRLALAVEDAPTALEWFQRVLGATPRHTPDGGGPGGELRDQLGRILRVDAADLEGTETRSFTLGGHPGIFLSKGVSGGPVSNFLHRYGPAVHSLAWEIEDMWSAQNLLMEHGIRTGSVNVPGRHFFSHPRDSHGILIEWTDVSSGPIAAEAAGPLDVKGLAWIAAAVVDADAAAAFLVDVVGGRPVTGNAKGPDGREVTVDVQVGDLNIRLVTPQSDDSPYAPFLETGPRLCTFALQVGNLDAALAFLAGDGVPTVRHEGDLAATDPAATFGIPLEWTV